MAVTESLAGSDILSGAEDECDENDLGGAGPCFRVHHRHGRDHDPFAERVMRDILIFLGRGFALFAGGPAIIFQYPILSRRVAVAAAWRRVRGSQEW